MVQILTKRQIWRDGLKRGKGTRGVLLMMIILLAESVSGCGGRTDAEAQGSEYAAVSMEDTPVIDYAVPRLVPNILVNRRGYPAEGEKEAALKGSKLPGQFALVAADSGQVVYTGEIQDIVYNEELGLYVGYADFSDYHTEGSYYLETEYIGRSYTFSIEEEMYQRLFEELYYVMLTECEEQTISLSDAVALLTAYEWYPEIFPNEDAEEAPDVLSELAKWISGRTAAEEEAGTEEALYVAFLAKFSYLYQKYDKQYATDCLRQASAKFEQVQKNMSKDAQSFFALTELYRATGYYTYRNQIADYKSYFENNSSYLEEPEYLYGAMTYMATRQRVDVELCNIFMSNLMDKSEEIAQRHDDMIHPVTAKNNGCDDLLKRVSQLSCANYVLKSYQYNCVMEELAHYLMGTNLKSVCFYPDQGSKTGYISLFAQLAAAYREA